MRGLAEDGRYADGSKAYQDGTVLLRSSTEGTG